MFQISGLAGRVDPHVPGGLEDLRSRIAEFREELRNHARMEEVFIHPALAQRVPGGARGLEREHEIMHRHLDDIMATADLLVQGPSSTTEIRALVQELYLAWNRFVAFYLMHIDAEEEQVQPALWRLCSEVEVRAMLGKILEAETPGQLAFDVAMMLPAMTRSERIEMVRSLVNPPPEVVRMFDDIARRVLSPDDYADLKAGADRP